MTDTGALLYHDGVITAEGVPPYRLPERITPEFIVSLFSAPPGPDPLFIANLAPDIAAPDRLRLHDTAKALGGVAWAVYRNNALKWRWLLNPDGQWHPERYEFVYQIEIGDAYECPYLDQLCISSRGLRLVKTPLGWRSFPEFEHMYGESVLEHLNKGVQSIRKRAEARCQALDSIVPHVLSDLVVRTLGVYTENKGLEQLRVVGLASIPSAEWKLPAGVSFAYEET